jgi:hypothetical protein
MAVTRHAAHADRGSILFPFDQGRSTSFRNLLTEGAETGDLRDDVAPDERASYCLHALATASSLPSRAAVRRLVTVILAGLHPRA